jgi:hypothetical protein
VAAETVIDEVRSELAAPDSRQPIVARNKKVGHKRGDERKHAGYCRRLQTVADCETLGFDDFEIFSLRANE